MNWINSTRHVAPFLILFLWPHVEQIAFAQWTTDGAKLSDRYENDWSSWKGAFSPGSAVGISSMAFDDEGTLYLACEKFPDVIILKEHEVTHRHLKLPGSPKLVDFEALSIYKDTLYLGDEDPKNGELSIYSVDLGNRETSKRIAVSLSVFGINTQIVEENKGWYGGSTSDFRSIEGLVVSDKLPGSSNSAVFYLLDEVDEVDRAASRYEAIVYHGIQQGDRLVKVDTEVRFPLPLGCRLCELFEHRGQLYALMTLYNRISRDSRYVVVRLQMESDTPNVGKIIEDCDFTSTATEQFGKLESNYEAAAVGPDDRLFLSADNEMLDSNELQNKGIFSPTVNGRRQTPLITLNPR